jgi:hypothetical protein
MAYYEYLVQFQSSIEVIWSTDMHQVNNCIYHNDRSGAIIAILRVISV